MARPANYQNQGGFGGGSPTTPAQYNFKYDVNDPKSGNLFGHEEEKDGDNTKGR